jgi:integrase
MALVQQGTIYYFVKRVPRRFAAYDVRKFVKVCLKTDSESEALRKVAEVEDNLEQYWVALSDGSGDEAKYDAMVKLAAARGVRYRPEKELMSRGLDEVLRRIEALEPNEAKDPVISGAVLGVAKRPTIKLSEINEMVFDLEKTKLVGKSEDQVRRYKNPKLKAFKNLVGILGDVDIASIERDDALEFRDWWQDKIVEEDLTANSANKDITNVSAALQMVIDRKRLPMENPFKGLRFEQGKTKARPPFSVSWITETFTEARVAGPDVEARDIFLTLVNTGCRPAEVAGLLPEDIRLVDNIPHIKIRANANRQIKNSASERDLPLVGISLTAMRRHPDGFPRYAGKDRFSYVMNRYLKGNGLMETQDHTIYGLRHSFEDRLLKLKEPDRLCADLMGHATARERYGLGATLDHKLEVLIRLAL